MQAIGPTAVYLWSPAAVIGGDELTLQSVHYVQSVDAMAGTLFGQDVGMVSCPAQLVDGGVRGLITGGMWGLAVAPLGISKENMSKEFTLRNTGKSVMGNSLLFGTFLSVYSGVKCTLDPVLKKQPSVNAFLSGSTGTTFPFLIFDSLWPSFVNESYFLPFCTRKLDSLHHLWKHVVLGHLR